MSNFIKRLILTLVSIPLLIFSLFWPQNSHIFVILFLGIIIIFFGSVEFVGLIERKGIKVSKWLFAAANLFIFTFSYFYVNNIFNIRDFKPLWSFFFLATAGIFSYIYAMDIFKKDFSKSLEKASGLILNIIYIGLPSFFIPFILNISMNPEHPVPGFLGVESHGTLTGSLMGFFLIVIVFGNDIFSYVFGMAFGKKNIINLEVSPKKSWAGYIGGFFSVFFWVTLYFVLFDVILGFLKFPVWFYYSMALIGAVVTPVGDLVESVFKRSVEVKDSGTLMMGRGGVLDSADSALYFIPVYFACIQVYFAFFP